MKRTLCALLASLFLLCACTGAPEQTAGITTEKETETAAADVSETDGQTSPERDDTVYISADTYYNNGYSSNCIAAIDKLGRAFDASVPKTDKNRQVGLFYFLLLGQHPEYPYSNKIFDTSKILQMDNGLDLMFDKKSQNNSIAPSGALYFWGEPLYGYYNMKDVWVIRRHLQLLTAAGVDFLCFDVTNAKTYDEVYKQIMKEICSLIEQGWENVPRVAFYTHTKSTNVVNHLYNNVYKKGLYKESWYIYKDKPLIVAYTDPEKDKKAAETTGYNPAKLSDEILDFFSFKDPVWPDENKVNENGLPWIDWKVPARIYGDTVNVAVAAHPFPPMSDALTKKRRNYGRGYSVEKKKNISQDAEKGTYFQSCWDNAVTADTDIVFVTGWNEWVAAKYDFGDEYGLVDLCNDEFSRDAEMMRGGYEDNFYLQLCDNIRRYKNTPVGEARADSKQVSIPFTYDISAWNDVKAVFRSVGTDNTARNSAGAATSVKYTQAAARNNLTEVRVTEDKENLYFLISSENEITAPDDGDNGWMNIFIGVGELSSNGFCGYQYVINKKSIELLEPDFTKKKCGECDYMLFSDIGKVQFRIPKSVLGIKGDANIYFKVADGIEHPGDIMDYYVSGRSLPMGRLSFRYIG